jgi:hypothetical protein
MSSLKQISIEENIKSCRLIVTKITAMLNNHRLCLSYTEKELKRKEIRAINELIDGYQRELDEILWSQMPTWREVETPRVKA